MIEYLDLRVDEVRAEGAALGHAVEYGQRLFVVAAPPVQVRLQLAQRIRHASGGVLGGYRFDFVPFLPVGEQTDVQRKFVILAVTFSEQLLVDAQGLV